MARRARVTGGRELRAAMQAIAAAVAGPLNEASKRALEPMRDRAKENVTGVGAVRTGELRKSLVVKRDAKRSTRLKPVYVVGPDAKSPAVRYGHLVEFGTSPHLVDGWMHPGAAPHPFLRPAFDNQKDAAVRIFGETIGPAMERQAERLAKRRARKGGSK